MKPQTPFEIAEKAAKRVEGKILTLYVSEDMDEMWEVRAKIQPPDKRRMTFEVAGIGETRSKAIREFFERVELETPLENLKSKNKKETSC